MIILTNKSYWGENIVSYDIIHDGYNELNEVMTDGFIAFTMKGERPIVDISLYGDSWIEGVHNYLGDIMAVLKEAEPQLFDYMLKISIEKVSDEELFNN